MGLDADASCGTGRNIVGGGGGGSGLASDGRRFTAAPVAAVAAAAAVVVVDDSVVVCDVGVVMSVAVARALDWSAPFGGEAPTPVRLLFLPPPALASLAASPLLGTTGSSGFGTAVSAHEAPPSSAVGSMRWEASLCDRGIGAASSPLLLQNDPITKIQCWPGVTHGQK